jgi:hypothetical protein
MHEEPRRELKIIADTLPLEQVRNIIHSNRHAFRTVHHRRRINNIYLDTPGFQHYYENVDGLAKRAKPRIRWYGLTCGRVEKPVLEIKFKNNLWGTKARHPIKPFEMDEDFRHSPSSRFFSEQNLPPKLAVSLATHQPVLGNTYQREYYLSFDGRYRLTLDIGVGYFYVHKKGCRLPAPHLEDPPGRFVIEIKCAQSDEPGLAQVSTAFPFRVTRNSKYVNGIRRIYTESTLGSKAG